MILRLSITDFIAIIFTTLMPLFSLAIDYAIRYAIDIEFRLLHASFHAILRRYIAAAIIAIPIFFSRIDTVEPQLHWFQRHYAEFRRLASHYTLSLSPATPCQAFDFRRRQL